MTIESNIDYASPQDILLYLQSWGFLMPSAKVRQKSKKRWLVDLHWQGKRYRRCMYNERIPFVHPDLAEEIAGLINADIKRLDKHFDPRQWFQPRGSELRFDKYAEIWLDKQTHLAPSYFPDVKSYVIRWMIPFFGQEDLRQIRKGKLKDFRDYLLEHYSPKTVQNILGIIHKIFSDAYDNEDILRIPPFPKVNVPEPELIWIPEQTVIKVIEQIPLIDQLIFKFGYFYALRPGEVRALEWDCVDFDMRLVTIKRTFSGSELREQTKTRNIRKLPLMDEPISILKRIRGISGFVFRTKQGKPYRKQRLSQLWGKGSDEAGVERIPLYNAMRHSRAMHLLEVEKWDLEYVRALLGHTRVEMTRRYARASAEGLRKRYRHKASDDPVTEKASKKPT